MRSRILWKTLLPTWLKKGSWVWQISLPERKSQGRERCTLYCTSAVQWKMGTRFNYKCIGFQEMCFERSIQTKTCLDLKYTQNDLSIQVSLPFFNALAKTKWQWHQLRCNYKCIGFLFSQEVAKPIYVVFTNSSSNAYHSEKSTGSWQRTLQIIIFSIHTSKMLVFSLSYDKL